MGLVTPFHEEAGRDGLTGGQLSTFCLAGSQLFPPVPPLGEGQERPMTGVCIAIVLWNDRTRHRTASDLNVSPWDGSWPTLPETDTGAHHFSCRERALQGAIS